MAKKKRGLLYVKYPRMFLTNVFRRRLYEENVSLGDDFERTFDIFSKGKKVVLFDELRMPRMVVSYCKVGIIELYNQKVRTSLARKQLTDLGKSSDLNSYYAKSLSYMISKAFSKGLKEGFYVLAWITLTSVATIRSKFKEAETKKGWEMRLRR